MTYIIKFIYGFILPPGGFVTLLVLLSIWLYRREKLAAKVLFIITLLLYISVIPLTGNILTQTLEQRHTPPSQVDGDVIVMLGGGATPDSPDIDGKGQLSGNGANRLLTTIRLYNQTKLPIILSGGQVFTNYGNEANIAKRQLISLGVPEEKIILENKSINTEQNAKFTKQLLKKHKLHKPILVTSAFHMERAIRNFNNLGISVQPYPTDYQSSQDLSIDLNQLTPSLQTPLFLAIKEYVGIAALYL